MFIRNQQLLLSENESTFFWGARQTGKSTLLKAIYPDALYFDLLLFEVYERLQRNPGILKESILASEKPGPVIVDEIQRIPALLNEIHWLIANKNIQFILSGSSPRKIIRSGANLLGGRATRSELYPLIYKEIPDFDILRALNHGLLPRHYLSNHPSRLISAYIGSYLQEEIMAEAKIRNIYSFSRFLEVAAFSNGEIVNYTNIAAECGVSAPTIKEYFHILEDTLIGRFLPSFQKKPKRRVILSPKFFYFDIAIANHFLKRKSIEFGSEAFGHCFEHFIYLEIYAHSKYSGLLYPISYWRTASQIEIDFVLGDHEVAIEVKGSQQINSRHLKGLKSFAEEYSVKKLILVSNDPIPRQMDQITALPWKIFLDKLWAGEIIS
jgi:predicted AAA+ superfamily ATPase